MCKFRFQLFDRAYLKERCADIPLGSDVTVMSRVARDGVNTYTVAEGHYGVDETDNVAYGVREDLLSDRPPFQTLYMIRGEVLARHDRTIHLPDFKLEQLVVGNLEEAIKQYELAVGVCDVEHKNRGQYGKCTLFELDIDEKGIPSQFIDEDKIIKQKFFIERG